MREKDLRFGDARYYNKHMKFRAVKRLLFFGALMALLFGIACASDNKLISSSVSGSTGSAAYSAPAFADFEHRNVTLADMTYTRPDIERMRAAMEDLRNGIALGKDAEEMIESYQALQQQYSHADSMLSLVNLLYAFDVTDDFYRNEYAYLQSALSDLDAQMQGVSATLFASSSRMETLARDSFGEGYVNAIIGNSFYDDATIQQLLDREEQLTLDYDRLSASFSLLDNGTRWTYADIVNNMSLSSEAYYRLYDAYCAAFNEKAGVIFLEQISIRAEIASRLGYKSYADYCFKTYGRDYTPEDAKTLHAAVKRYISPLFVAAMENKDTSDLDIAFFEEDTFFAALLSSSAAFSPMLGEPVAFMLQNRLYDVTDSSVKMDASFTTYIADYRAPFIFSRWIGSADNVATMLHELGHFSNYYHNAVVGYSAGDSLDLAEVDAQALVLLLFDDYEHFYGDLADEARTAALIDAMYALVSGCMEDEFQQEVYANPRMTLDEINALYARLSSAYGLEQAYGYRGTEWALITHTFQTPLYYISYAASMVPALELFEMAQTDVEAAKAAYFRILTRESYASLGDVLSDNGLAPVFSESTIANIAKMIDAFIN